MVTYIGRLGAVVALALVLGLASWPRTSEAGGPPAVRVEGAGIEEPFLLDSGNWTNDYSAMRTGEQSIDPARLEAVLRSFAHRPRIELQVYYRYASPCARDTFTFHSECANQVIEFYPAHGAEPAVFARELTDWGVRGRIWLPSEFALDHMAALGIATRIDPATITTEAQAGWVGGAALLGLSMAASLRVLARPRGRLELATVGTKGP